MRGSSWALAFALVAVTNVAHATLIRALSLGDLVQRADHVVLATCVDKEAHWDARDRIVTDYALRVEEVMKGSAVPGGTLSMRRLGGVIGDLGMRIEGEPILEVGATYLLFLRTQSDGRTLRPVGMSQGVMPVGESGGDLFVHPGGAGLGLVQRVRGGRLTPAPPALLRPEPYLELRDRLQRMIEAEAPSGTVDP